MLDVGSVEGVPTGFWQLIGGQVALALLVSKVESLDGRLPKLLAVESAVAVLIGGLEPRAEIRWHRAGLGAAACSAENQGESGGREEERSTSQAHGAISSPCPAESPGSTS